MLLLNKKTIDYNKFKESEIEIKELKRQLTEKEEQNNEKSNQVLEIKHQFELFEKQIIQERKDFDKKQVEFSKSIEILTNTNVSILNDFEKQRKNKKHFARAMMVACAPCELPRPPPPPHNIFITPPKWLKTAP